MLVATITEAKNRLSALLDQVRGGQSVLIVDRGVPVARLESVITADSDSEGRLARLQRAGAVRTATQPLPTELFTTLPPRPEAGASAVAALLTERREGR